MTNKITFTHTSNYVGQPETNLTMELKGDLSLSEVLENFAQFLRGAGYYFDGYVDIVNDDEPDYDSDNEPDTDPFFVNFDDSDSNVVISGSMDDINLDLSSMDFSTMAGAQPVYSVSTSNDSDIGHSIYYYDSDRNK